MEKTYHPILISIAEDVIGLIQENSQVCCITDAYRDDPESVHGHCRGLDFRTWDMPVSFINALCEAVNTLWTYDPKRPEKVCLMYHDVGQGAHLHLQVHPNTVRKNN